MQWTELCRDIVETSPDGIWVFDLDGRTIYANPGLVRMLGAAAEEMPRITYFDSLDAVGRGQFAEHLAALRRGQVNEDEVECKFVRRDGSTFWVLVRESVLHTPDGSLAGVLHRFRDDTARRRTVEGLRTSQRRLEELRTSQSRLAEAQRIARLGAWSWDVERDEIIGSAELYELFGLDRDTFPGNYREFIELVHEDDRETAATAVQSALDGTDGFDFVVRIRSGEEWKWTRGRGVVRRTAEGHVSMSGTHQDVTEARQAELELEDQVLQNTLMRAVASAANEATTLTEVLQRARSLVLLHEDWRRARAFLPAPDGGGVRPLYLTAAEEDEDRASPEDSTLELSLARRAFREGVPVWDDARLLIAFPVLLDGEPCAVLTITSAPPLYRHAMIESMVEQVAVQLGTVAERERTQRELAAARDQAMEASRQKSEFLATMSHEIRTPLNGIIGLNDLLLRTGLDADRLRLASGVQVASRALLGVINDILDFSKLEAGRLELERLDFAVRPVLDQVASVLAETARAKGVALAVSCDPGVPGVLSGDPTRLCQVLNNLVSNALKFTDRGEVVVRATSSPASGGGTLLRVEVADTGIGLAEGDVPGIFEPFSQADASTTRLYGGTGLGLAIAREIVQALGGEIGWAPNPGGGSIFHFTARFDAPSRPPTDLRAAVLPPEPQAAADPGAATTTAGPVRAPRRILVVEDNPVNQMVATGLLERMGHHVEIADDGVLAQAALVEGTFDAVLMDVQMPRMDGYAATRAIRGREGGGPRTPVIAMTAAAVQGERERCLAAGMDDYLTKPVDPAALARVLGRWLEAERSGPAVDRQADPAVDAPADPFAHPTVEARIDPVSGLDTDRLDMLRDLDPGSTAYLDRAIGNFLANSRLGLDTISAAVAAGDAATLRSAAHKLAGSALNLGVGYAGEAARALELLGDAGTTQGGEALLGALDDALERGRSALLAYQASYQAS